MENFQTVEASEFMGASDEILRLIKPVRNFLSEINRFLSLFLKFSIWNLWLCRIHLFYNFLNDLIFHRVPGARFLHLAKEVETTFTGQSAASYYLPFFSLAASGKLIDNLNYTKRL